MAMIPLSRAPATIPPGRRIYAIGDIHGCDAQLANLHEIIAEDLARRPIDSAVLLHIGDYVDRGADTAGVLARLAAGSTVDSIPTINLLGNHDETMLHALSGDRAAATDWLFAGGKPALESYGIDPDSPRDSWLPQIPPAHLDFLRHLALCHREGGYFFVHAGVRPGVALEQQRREDMLRIRQPFLYTEHDLGAVVVHGHTPVKAPVVRHNRIAIDTGAVFGGKLTCVVLEGETIGFLTADPVGDPVSIAHR
ncbi:MAG TPA: metallophosphoesterase [Acetobacteraceae bacterium]|jgi:serine/threonine protein phosphatase 1|nr:metallophosphoesterase [Acetobacteraceae bacterium]